VNVARDSELLDVTITWAGGHQTSGQAVRPVGRLDQLSHFPAMLARVTALAGADRNSMQIADIVTTEGDHRGIPAVQRTSRFNGQQARTLISQRGVRAQAKGGPAVLTNPAPGARDLRPKWAPSDPAKLYGPPLCPTGCRPLAAPESRSSQGWLCPCGATALVRGWPPHARSGEVDVRQF
jgi:hypothetical protein